MNRRGFISATGAMLGTGAIAGVVSFPLISALPPEVTSITPEEIRDCAHQGHLEAFEDTPKN
jgi:hypothetical protein